MPRPSLEVESEDRAVDAGSVEVDVPFERERCGNVRSRMQFRLRPNLAPFSPAADLFEKGGYDRAVLVCGENVEVLIERCQCFDSSAPMRLTASPR